VKVFDGKIIVLKGGYSSEREISLKSAENVEKALQEIGYNYNSIDCTEGFIQKLINSGADLCFNSLHGELGEDGKIQAILENLNIKYTHSNISSSLLAMNKVISKEIFKKNKIQTPKYKLFEFSNFDISEQVPPFVIKPISNGSSIGIYIILDESDKIKVSKELKNWGYGNSIMIEEYIEGKELTCGIINDQVTDVMEIKTDNNFYDYTTKYTQGESSHIIPAEITELISNEIKAITRKCHDLLECNGVTRTDFRLGNSQKNELTPFVLEINTHPGLTETSLIPDLAMAMGISYNELINLIIKEAICRR